MNNIISDINKEIKEHLKKQIDDSSAKTPLKSTWIPRPEVVYSENCVFLVGE